MTPGSIDGFYILDKPQGWTSSGVVIHLKRKLRVKKIGHTGTLDPLATGVLPIAVGEATKVIPFLDEREKIYEVSLLLGKSTDTYDSTGKVLATGDWSKVTPKILEQELGFFLGPLMQKPPLFSAVKFKGKPLYTYARQGQTPERKERGIEVFESCLLQFEENRVRIRFKVSKGTYIRSLVHDLGIRLGCFAHMTDLLRVQSGFFSLGKAQKLDSFLAEDRLSIEEALGHLPKVDLKNNEYYQRVKCGGAVFLDSVQEQKLLPGQVFAFCFEGKVVALVKLKVATEVEYLRVLNI